VSKSQRRELELLIHRLVDVTRAHAAQHKPETAAMVIQAQLKVSEKLDEIEWDYQEDWS